MPPTQNTCTAFIECPCGYYSHVKCRPDDPEHAKQRARQLGWRFPRVSPVPPRNGITYFLRGQCEECYELDK